MKTILAMLAISGLSAAPALAMCGHDQTAQSKATVEVAETMSMPAGVDMETTASIPSKDAEEDIEPATE